MSARRAELTRAAARLFAQKGYHGTSVGDLAEALGVQKGSLYAHIDSKADLLSHLGVDTFRISWQHGASLGGRVGRGSVFIR
jgi:AcrR family transcriptional regulator